MDKAESVAYLVEDLPLLNRDVTTGYTANVYRQMTDELMSKSVISTQRYL